MTSDALKWARKQGLNCELDIMAAQLRSQQWAQIARGIQVLLLSLILARLLSM